MWRKWLWITFETIWQRRCSEMHFLFQLAWWMFGKNYSELRHVHSLRCTRLFWVIWPVVLILHYSNFSPGNQPHPITCLGWMTKCALGGALCTFALLNICTLYICTFVQIWARSKGESLGWLHIWCSANLADCPTMSFVLVCWHSRKWEPPICGGLLQMLLLRLEKVN